MKININGHEIEGTPEEIIELIRLNNNFLINNQNIPSACRYCPNHPSNGGSGNCNCILGIQQVYC